MAEAKHLVFHSVATVDKLIAALEAVKKMHGGNVPIYLQTFRTDSTETTWEGPSYGTVGALSYSATSTALEISTPGSKVAVPIAVKLHIT